MAKNEKDRKLCECEKCVVNRFVFCEDVENQIEAKRKAGKPCPPPVPPQNAPSTMRLQ